MKRTLRILTVVSVISIVFLGDVFAQEYDISSGGMPTITGALGGWVTGNADSRSDLTVTINLGELSPLNVNGIVKVVVPVGIRSTGPYRIEAHVTGSVNANIQAIQRSDIGFGVGNLRPLGNQSQVCTNSSHIFYSPFDSDPANIVFINAGGRAAYPASLGNLSTSTTIMSGPRLSRNNANRGPNNAWTVDAVFAIVPQFYASGSSSATITFTILPGPNVPC